MVLCGEQSFPVFAGSGCCRDADGRTAPARRLSVGRQDSPALPPLEMTSPSASLGAGGSLVPFSSSSITFFLQLTEKMDQSYYMEY